MAVDRPTVHDYQAVIVGAGGAGLWAALELARKGVKAAVLTKLYPRGLTPARPRAASALPLATRKRTTGNGTCTTPSRAATTWSTRTRPRSSRARRSRRVFELEHMGLPFNRTPDGKIDQRRFGGHTRNYGEGPVRRVVLRRRPHRPHDPADALPAVHQARRQVLRRVPRRGPVARRRPGRGRGGLPHCRWRPAHLPINAVMFATGGFGRMYKITSNALALTGDGLARATAAGCRWRTWSSSSSTRPASTASASCCPRRRAARAASCATGTASGSWSATRRRSRTSRRATWCRARSTRRCAKDAASTASDCVYLDLTPPRQEVIDEKLPDITEFARVYQGDRAHHAAGPGPRRQRTTRWAASRPTSTAAWSSTSKNTVAARALRRRGVRLRVRPRREPAGHQLAGRHPGVRPTRRAVDGRRRRRAPSCRTVPADARAGAR